MLELSGHGVLPTLSLMALDRRALLRQAAGLGAMALIPGPFLGLAGCSARRDGALPDVRHAGIGQGGYGDLVPSRECPELALPRDFRAVRLSVSGERMSDGATTPGAFDGMAAFPLPNGHIRLVRNHEIFTPRRLGDVAKAYDAMGGGGTTSLEVLVGGDGTVAKVRDFVSLGGTVFNCAGGPTPWRTWLSCEETVDGPRAGWQRPHGYVFEVSADAEAQVEARPLRAMGRFVHEAVAVDRATGIVYLTEDMTVDRARNRLGAGFYRFVPRVPGQLSEGGRLQALGVEGQPRYQTYHGQHVGAALPTVWVDVPDPDPADAEIDVSAVLRQAVDAGAAVFKRLEGCSYGFGRVFFSSASGGDAERGQVWQHRPRGGDRGELTLVFESPATGVAHGPDKPDNITVSPRSTGLLVCEDNGHRVHLCGITPEGAVFDFARNLADTREFAGVCFSPDGETLFVNLQGWLRRSATYAIRGPWRRGAL
jgi:secreted PhoX family phosphatase